MTSLLDFIHSMSLSASNKQWLADHLYEEAKQERAVKLPHITKDDLTIDPAVDNLFNVPSPLPHDFDVKRAYSDHLHKKYL